jgi:hypothetical protein
MTTNASGHRRAVPSSRFFEAETLERARKGDPAARRDALALAADAIRRGLPLSGPLRVWFADALVLLQAAIEGDAAELGHALVPLGFDPKPAHRPADPGAILWRIEIAAAVHVLVSKARVRKSLAMSVVADAVGTSLSTIERAVAGLGPWPANSDPETRVGAADIERVALPVFDKMRALNTREPLHLPQEVVKFLTAAVDRDG